MKKNSAAEQLAAVVTAHTPLDWPHDAGVGDSLWEKVELKVKQKRRRRRRIATSGVALAILTAIGFWAIPFLRETGTVETSAGHRETVALADGSHADLNARTNLHTDFRYGRRVVRLDRGEAYFAITRDPAHPFLVETAAGIVRVTGTKFNVRLAGADHVEITLLEGSVTVTPESAVPSDQSRVGPVYLVPGQQLVLDHARSDVSTLTAAGLESTIAWRQGRLVLDGMTLAEAAARFAAYHGKRIDIAPEVAGLRPGGSCPLDDLSEFLGAMQDALPVRVIPSSEGGFRIIHR